MVPTSPAEPGTTVSTVPTLTSEPKTTVSTAPTPTAEPVITASTVPISTAEATTKPPECQNGGFRNGSEKCNCLIGFSGDLCQYVTAIIAPERINTTVIVEMVVKQIYLEEYDDPESGQYKMFAQNFTQKMEGYYETRNITNFKGVIVIELRVNVKHDIVLEFKNDASFEAEYRNNFDEIKVAIDNLKNCSKGICGSIIPVPALLELYEAKYDKGWICVTMCDARHSTPKTCYHSGTCNVYTVIGPLCECQNIDATWYLGDDCSFPIHKIAFYAGLSATLAVLLLTAGALSAYLVVNKQRQKRIRDFKDKLLKEWLDKDMVWPKSSNNHTATSGMYSNPSFSTDENPTSQQGTYLHDREAPWYWRGLNLQSPVDSNSALPSQNQPPLHHLSGNQPKLRPYCSLQPPPSPLSLHEPERREGCHVVHVNLNSSKQTASCHSGHCLVWDRVSYCMVNIKIKHTRFFNRFCTIACMLGSVMLLSCGVDN
ncbi:Mucin-3B [Merluccius polli]|uniref:Mucin-3B n=1 Tax=Merluccius polli TaxID=89951 RepID=A0AA47P3M1_MERPO|nr:Mucin-3B [Merluccius polli]